MISLLYVQQYKKNTFEYKFLSQIKSVVEDSNLRCYFGFDFGFFSGINIYYGSSKDDTPARHLYTLLKNENLNIRMMTNIDYDFDIIVLFGYINNYKEKIKLLKNKKNIVKALSLFFKCFKK